MIHAGGVVMLLLLAIAPAVAAERLVGRAHTIDVGGIRVRLQGVAAPEVEHPAQPEPEPDGPEAAVFMAQLADSRTLVRELSIEETLRY